MSDWHFRYRRIIDLYRTSLQRTNPDLCEFLDIQVARWGEGWVSDDGPLPQLDELWTAAEIANKWGFNRWDVANWVRAGKIQRHQTELGPKYRVGDVLAYFSKKNRRK